MNKKSHQAKVSGRETEAPKASNNDLWNQLANVVTMAAKEDQIVWTIFGVFWAANAVLLVALFTTGEIPSVQVGFVISATGTLLSYVWFIIQRRAIRWLEYYEKIIFQIEKEYLMIPSGIALSPRVNDQTFMEEVGHGFRVRFLMVISGAIVAIGWIAALAWFAWSLWFTHT
ncbi:MAG TPA: hypothetical protein VK206_11840 [Anaerolineales bacterium]|nr:hypothetical protein [Anaerolineales bacterium]HLO31295.1 hypothetical protein [Anaerolineales bacterium]